MQQLNPSMRHADHSTDDLLEEFLFGRLPEHVLEIVETHVLACESCVARVEALEAHIATMKLALADARLHESANTRQLRRSVWHWLSLPTVAWATAAALLALCLSLPQLPPHRTPRPEVILHAYRGSETAVVPLHRSVVLRMDALDLPADDISVQIVDVYGTEAWTGRTSVKHERAEVILPPQPKTGTYFLRLYRPSSSSTDVSLLREFEFEVH
jgi:hypothetical protein